MDWHTFKTFVWSNHSGSAYAHDGGFIFWADKDGTHIEFRNVDKDGNKEYLSKSACVNDNVRVVEFTEDLPAPKGEYTVTREFTVKADSEEEAESIVDEATKKIK